VKTVRRLKTLVEEIFPFLFYWARKRQQLKRVDSKELGAIDGPEARYHKLSEDDLNRRILEERERARAMDDKTFKMTLSLTLGLTVLGSTTSILVKTIPFETIQIAVAAMAALSIFYSLSAGLISMGALKTLPSFGYGTDFLLEAKEDKAVLVSSLVSQEVMNLVRHLRNECAYQSLRNGFLCLFTALALFAGALAYDTLLVRPRVGIYQGPLTYQMVQDGLRLALNDPPSPGPARFGKSLPAQYQFALYTLKVVQNKYPSSISSLVQRRQFVSAELVFM